MRGGDDQTHGQTALHERIGRMEAVFCIRSNDSAKTNPRRKTTREAIEYNGPSTHKAIQTTKIRPVMVPGQRGRNLLGEEEAKEGKEKTRNKERAIGIE